MIKPRKAKPGDRVICSHGKGRIVFLFNEENRHPDNWTYCVRCDDDEWTTYHYRREDFELDRTDMFDVNMW